jgi:hypothetical protein
MKGFLLIFSERGIGSAAMERNVIWDTLLKSSTKLFYRSGPIIFGGFRNGVGRRSD